MQFKINTQKGLILEKMADEPKRWFLAGEFCGGSKDCPFIGYKAHSRIVEMRHDGLLINRWSDKRTALGSKLKEYRINDEYYRFRMTDKHITASIKPSKLFS